MAVTIDDVRHIAELARLGLDPHRARSLVAELNTILGHMEELSKVDTAGVEPTSGVGARAHARRLRARNARRLLRRPAPRDPRDRRG
jgi:aspartyl/glutamyl-tRNA(Asn/Gln) amidotransferase C subunit